MDLSCPILIGRDASYKYNAFCCQFFCFVFLQHFTIRCSTFKVNTIGANRIAYVTIMQDVKG